MFHTGIVRFSMPVDNECFVSTVKNLLWARPWKVQGLPFILFGHHDVSTYRKTFIYMRLLVEGETGWGVMENIHTGVRTGGNYWKHLGEYGRTDWGGVVSCYTAYSI